MFKLFKTRIKCYKYLNGAFGTFFPLSFPRCNKTREDQICKLKGNPAHFITLSANEIGYKVIAGFINIPDHIEYLPLK